MNFLVFLLTNACEIIIINNIAIKAPKPITPISNFFNNSVAQFASFFAKSNTMSIEELEKLREVIDNEIDRKKK